MNRAFTFAENSASVWRTTCTSRKAEQNGSLRKAHLWRTHSGKCRTRFRISDLLFDWDAVMGSDHLPGVPNLDPDISQPVVILVRLVVGRSLLVIRARHHSDVATHPHPQVRQFGDFHPNRWIGAVRNVTRFAVGVAIFNRDHEFLGQERSQKINLSFLVSCCPFFFQLADLRSGARRLLRSQTNRQTNEQPESQPRRRADSHDLYVIPHRSAMTSSYCGPSSPLVAKVRLLPEAQYPCVEGSKIGQPSFRAADNKSLSAQTKVGSSVPEIERNTR